MKKPIEELDKFKEATLKILAKKIHLDYHTGTKLVGPIEPEHFFEMWLSRNIIKPNKSFKTNVWRFFIQALKESANYK